MRHWLLWLTLLLLVSSSVVADEQLFGGGGSGGGGIVSTMIGGRITDDSLALIYTLGSFASPPAHPKVYFSSDDADSGLPVGNDSTGDGSKSAPFRTIEKAVEISNQGYVEIVWDCEDTWDSTGDWGTIPAAGFLVNMPCTDMEEEACVIWSSTDPTGQCRWTHDYATLAENPGTRLYGWSESEETWWGVQNGRVINFPPTPAHEGDIFRSEAADAKQHVVVMNFEAPNLQGQNNQFRTSHGTVNHGANFLAINVDGTCQDRAGVVATVGPTTINVVKAGAGTCPGGGGDCLQGPDWVAEGFTDSSLGVTVGLTGFADNNVPATAVSVDSTNMILEETDLVSETGTGDEVVEEEYGCQVIHDTGDSMLMVVGGTYTLANGDTNYIHGSENAAIKAGLHQNVETVIVGAKIRDTNPPVTASVARTGIAFPVQGGSVVSGVIANTTISGFSGGGQTDSVIRTIQASINSGLSATFDLRMYKVSFLDVRNWISGRYGGAGTTMTHVGRCLAGDTPTGGKLIHGVSSNDCAQADYDFRAVYFDDTANPSFRGGSMGDKNTAAEFVADSAAAGCNGGLGFTEWGTDADSVNSSTSPFLSGTAICDIDTGCFEGCPYEFVYDFKHMSIPRFVTGRKVTGLHLGTASKKNLGN